VKEGNFQDASVKNEIITPKNSFGNYSEWVK